ncbi:hypothetical protein L596_026826 [Steinernema carpocapsae]|uniref:AB hydrolase-1 domain-containing protein n=1 Tax=Steinernema carpocapsae TaxID=34508 RepID=A0A4U5M2K1_STECR|nr:hypothetical protein L596_026826 [Steinernema carpocapsae]
MVNSGKVEMYDYRSVEKNQKHYGSSNPPEYDFTTITTPMYLYWSDADWLATKDDITDYLLPNLNPQAVVQNNFLDDFNHLDFIWGLRAPKEIYEPILEIIKKDLA